MASNCMTLSNSICRGCRDNAGGLKVIYVADYYKVDWANIETIAEGENKGAVTDLPLETYGQWFKLEPNKYSASWTENINVVKISVTM